MSTEILAEADQKMARAVEAMERDLVAGAIVERNDERQRLVAARQILGLFEETADVGIEIGALADHPHTHAIAMQFCEILADKKPEKSHQVADFGRGPLPVFRGKREDREALDAHFARGANGLAQRFDAAAVSLDTGQSARRRPATISIHDDGDMTRHAGNRPGDIRRLRLWHGHNGPSVTPS